MLTQIVVTESDFTAVIPAVIPIVAESLKSASTINIALVNNTIMVVNSEGIVPVVLGVISFCSREPERSVLVNTIKIVLERGNVVHPERVVVPFIVMGTLSIKNPWVMSVRTLKVEEVVRGVALNTTIEPVVIVKDIIGDESIMEVIVFLTVGTGTATSGDDINMERAAAGITLKTPRVITPTSTIPVTSIYHKETISLLRVHDTGESVAISTETSTTAVVLADEDIGGTIALAGQVARAEPREGAILRLGNLSLTSVTRIKITVTVVGSADEIAVTTLALLLNARSRALVRVNNEVEWALTSTSLADCGGAVITNTSEEEMVSVLSGVAIVLILIKIPLIRNEPVATRVRAIKAPADIVRSVTSIEGSDIGTINNNPEVMVLGTRKRKMNREAFSLINIRIFNRIFNIVVSPDVVVVTTLVVLIINDHPSLRNIRI